MTPSGLIAFLNAIRVGEFDVIRVKLRQAVEACVALREPGLAELLKEAEGSLDRADLKTYRMRLETVIARLGHLR
jgi:hypothetical protein